MARTIFLAIYTNGPKPAHWGVWVPTGGEGEVGKMIHTTGNPAVGFFLEFKRNHNIASTETPDKVIPLGQVQDNFVSDGPRDRPETKDTIARDRLETTATTVPPPPKSANPFNPAAPNCQNWIFTLIEKLIAEGHLEASAGAVLQSAPRYI